MKLYSKVMAALLAASLAAQLMVPAYAYNVSSDTSTGGQVVINNQDGTQQILTQEDLENGADLPEGIVIENGENTQAPATPAPEVSQAPAQESEAPAQESEAPAQETPAPTQSGGDTNSDRIDMNLPVVSPSTGNGSDGSATQQETPLAVYWNPGSGYELDQSKLSVAFQGQQSQKGIIQQGLSWLSNLVSGVFGGGSKTVQVPAGKDSNSGRSPMAPVKTFEAAMEQAQALADEQGVDVRDVTIYSMNPQEVLDGETLEVSGANLTVQAWEGRTYDSDVLFYVNDGTLTMEGVNLLARDEENEEESAQTLVQVFDGSVVMGASVAVNGGFTLDFRSAESEKLWDEDSALTDEKVGSPVIELTEDFQPDSSGYSITVLGQSEENERQEVVRTSGMTDAQVHSYAGSFALMGEDSQGLSLEVDQQDQNQSATTVDSGAAPASLSLYAVRDASKIIYWNPGGEFEFNGKPYPAGSDTDRTGLDPKYPLKTFAKALEKAQANTTRNIVCMQTITVNESTFASLQTEGYLTVEGTTIKLHGDQTGGDPIVLTNWDQRLPIIDIEGKYTLSMENVQLKGYGSDTTQRTVNLVSVGKDTNVFMGASATVTDGAYIQMDFSQGAPNPIQVNSETAGATIFASGVMYAPHFDGTKLVQATETLVSQLGDKDAAGKYLAGQFYLSTLNTSPSPSGQDRPVKWSLVQNTTSGEENSLVLKAAKTYETIYIDPKRGNDSYDGLTCQFPVATMERALKVLQEGIDTVLEQRAQAKKDGKTDEWIELNYPLPGHLAACSTIEITDTQKWDWSTYEKADYTGTVVKPYLTAHEEGGLGANEQPTHQASQYVIRVTGSGASLILKDVEISRTLSTVGWNLINVVDGGQLTLDGATELFTQAQDQTQATPAYMGVGIVAGWNEPMSFTPGSMSVNASSAATITMEASWTGKIHGLSRGVLLIGKQASMTMNGGTITDNRNSEAGAGVSAFQGAKFTMKGGTISNNQAAIGAGVLVSSKYKPDGLGLDVSSKFTMTAGTIQGNTIDLDVDEFQGYDGMGGAGILSYYAVVELGQGQDQKNACRIEGNSLSRDTSWNRNWGTCTGVGVSIYGQNTWDGNALIVNGATVTGNMVDDGAVNNYQKSLNVVGIGLGLSEVKSVQVENADITNNYVKKYYRGTTDRSLAGGGLYVSGSSDATSLIFRGLNVTGNSLNGDGFSITSASVGTSGGGIHFGTIPDTAITLLENSTVSNNTVAMNGSSIDGSGGGIYTNALLRLNNVTISGNQAGNAQSRSGDGGGIYGCILWAKDMVLENNKAKHTGGGWYSTADGNRHKLISTVIQDSQITGNQTLQTGYNEEDGDGGGIYITSSSLNGTYSCTLTETPDGKTVVTGNTAAKNGGGVCTYVSDVLILDFAGAWENTASKGANLWLNMTSATSGASTHILKGTFKGTESVYVEGRSKQGKTNIDLDQVMFEPNAAGKAAIYLSDPGGVVNLLTRGNASHPLCVGLNNEKFGAGNIVVRPSNLSQVTVGTLNATSTAGKYEVGSTNRTYPAFTDIGSTPHITAEGLPLRTQLKRMKDGDLMSLGIVAEGVYLDPTNGSNNNDGLSPDTAVKTWEVAAAKLKGYALNPPNQTTGLQPVIWVCNTVTFTNQFGEKNIPLSLGKEYVGETYKQFEKKNNRKPELAVFRRYGTFTNGPMFHIKDYNVTVTAKNVRFDGNSGGVTSPQYNYIFQVQGTSSLIVGDGARLYNSHDACVRVDNTATLQVTQSFKPGDIDLENDEKYGLQIDADGVKKSGGIGGNAVSVGDRANVTLTGNAYIGGDPKKSGTQADPAISFYTVYGSAGTITMQDNALIRDAIPISMAYPGKVEMDDSARIEAGYNVFDRYAAKNTVSSLIMRGNSSIGVVEGKNAVLPVASAANLSIEMYNTSRIECEIVTYGDPLTSKTQDAGLKIVMGTKGGTDEPKIIVPKRSGSPYPGSMRIGGGHLYLEMNANSKIEGGIAFLGLYSASPQLQNRISTFGLVMRDSAKITAGDGSAGVTLATGSVSMPNVGSQTYTWDKTIAFAIQMQGSAAIEGGIQSDFTYDTSNPQMVMGDDQQITLQDNAQVKGSIGNKDKVIGLSSVVLEGNSSVEPKDGMTAQDKLVTAHQVTLKDQAHIGAIQSPSGDTGEESSEKYGEYVSLYILNTLNLYGTATVDGPIQLAQNANITLMSPVPEGIAAGCFKLHLAAYHMGEVVVKPDGTTVTDASTYLPYFVKAAAQGEASKVNLVEDDVNIILNRLWNVYLSTNGNDTNNGASADSAVRTFKKARELLRTKKGYGPGSNIIIADSVTIQQGDNDWGFQGGTVTNGNQTWTPVITRVSSSVYNQPSIIITEESVTNGEQIKFHDITLDAGGENVQFALTEAEKPQDYQNSLIYIQGLSKKAGSSVLLGEGTVLQNLKYDMTASAQDKVQLGKGPLLGGYAIHVEESALVMDGCTIKDFNIQNINYHYEANSQNTNKSAAAIIYATGANGSLEFKSGQICNNSIDIDMFNVWGPSSMAGILAVNDGTQFTMSGGEIYENLLSGPGQNIGCMGVSDILPTGIIALSKGKTDGTSMELLGGSIHDNENKVQSDEQRYVNARFAEGIICVGSTREALGLENTANVPFTMRGGSITNNTSRRGSAIALINGTVTLSGGTIQGNRSVVDTNSDAWKAEYSPIFLGSINYGAGIQQLVLEGSGCMLEGSIFLPSSRQIVVSDRIRDTQRVYQVYMEETNVTQGSVVVVPDGGKVSDVTPYLQNFQVYAKGMVLDRGRVNRTIEWGSAGNQKTVNEQNCLLLMRAVFVDGDGETDLGFIDMTYPPEHNFGAAGLTPESTVKTLDMAKAVGQSVCYYGEATEAHEKHKDHYVVYAVGPVYNDLTTGNIFGGSFNINKDPDNFVFSLEGASYLARYTGWELYDYDGKRVQGDSYYGNVIQVREGATATLRDITVQGRREIDSVANNGETLVVVNPGATLTIADGTNLQRNNVSGTRPDPNDPGVTQPIDARGGAIRAEAGAKLIMTGGVIDSTCTALDGGSIYLEGGADSKQTAQLTISNQVNIGGEIYLGGAQGKDIPISVDRTFAPVSPIRIGMESDYDTKPVVRWTDGTLVTEPMLEQFSYSSSVTALYKTKAISSTGAGQPDTIALDLRKILYLDPAGEQNGNGSSPDQAVNSIEQIYTMLQSVEDIPGVLVFVMNPITVGSKEQLVISNGQLNENGVTKHISVYSKNTRSDTFDTNIGIVQGTNEMSINCELYFRRYVETSDKPAPEGYDRESNLKELFVVQDGGQLQLNGMYLDGQSLGIQTTGNPGLSSHGVVAQAPLVRVEAGGSAQFLTGALPNYQSGSSNYQASSSMLTNNTNNKPKKTIVPGTTDIIEGSSAGIEILSSGIVQDWANEPRGKVVLQNTKLDNLKLDADQSGKAVIGGSDIYQNGELWISDNTRFGGTVFLEGNGRSGDDADAEKSRQTSRWINVRAYGSPVETTFMVSVRDPYQNRRMVVYPDSKKDEISKEEIAFYMLTQEASRNYVLINEKLGADGNFMGYDENTLWLRVPPVVYIDPVNGSDENRDGRYPDTAVKTLPKAIDVMKGLSAKVLYVLSPIPITGNSYLYPTGYTYDGTAMALPSQNMQLTIRRYVQPDAPTTAEHYKTASYTSGALFDIQSSGSLTLEGNVILDGASQGQTGPEVPADQTYVNGVQVTAPLVTVQQGGTLELRSDGEGEEVTRPTLTNNDNTGTVGATSAQRVAGGAINNEGTVILNGGMLVNNKAESVTGTDGMKGMANGIYQAGDLTIRSYPQGLTDQSVYLAANHVISVDMQIQEMGDAAGEISLDMDNAVAGRDVVTYTNATNVDAESARYSLGNSVPGSLFLVQAADNTNTLELQDWQQLNVTVPEEVFLVVYDTGANGAQVGKGDVDSYGYGVPEYTITNGGTRNVRVSVNGFDVAAVRNQGNITLVDSAAGLTGEGALLYLALTKSSETAEAGNSFANLAETSLKLSTDGNIPLGTLKTGAHGSFAFTGSANQAFLNQWMDSAFPANPPEGKSLAEARREHMRTKNAETGETSLANAAAQFKLTYRIELA